MINRLDQTVHPRVLHTRRFSMELTEEEEKLISEEAFFSRKYEISRAALFFNLPRLHFGIAKQIAQTILTAINQRYEKEKPNELKKVWRYPESP